MESHSIRRFSRCDSANSPEFEFWNLGRNPSPTTTTLHSADELFSDGFLLPLHLLPDYPSHTSHPDPTSEPDPEPCPSPDSDPDTSASASITSSAGNPILTASKRWKEIIFKRGEKSTEKIKIWPFSRSRSAGNNSGRSRPAVLSNRKVSSAPCSRSNSSGESKTRRAWTGSPGRTGVHLGRSSPVWQVRRSRLGSDRGKAAGKGRVLNLNVPMCIGYRQHLGCRSDENGAVGGGGDGGEIGEGGSRSGGGGSSGSNGNLFSLRGLFGKKSVLTV